MANERDDEKSTQAEHEQTTGGQQSHRSEYGEQGRQTETSSGQPIGGNDSQTGSGTPLSEGAEPPRSMGTRGTEFGQFGEQGDTGQQGQSGMGQSDLGSQAGSTLAGRADQQDLGQDQPGSAGGSRGERFIGSQGTGSEEYLQQRSPLSEKTDEASSAKATGGTEFEREGRGAAEEDDNAGGEGGAG